MTWQSSATSSTRWSTTRAPLRALVSSVVSLDELPEVFESLRGGSAECKVIVDPRAE